MANRSSVRMEDVASAADVSVSTVSRALRDDPSISLAARRRIHGVAQTLDYQPLRRRDRRKAASALSHFVAGKNLAVLTLGMHRSLTTVPVVSAAIAGVEHALSMAGCRLQVSHVPQLDDPPRHLLQQKLDGVFLVGAMQGRMLVDAGGLLVDRLSARPCVWLLGRPEGCSGHSVGSDDVQLGVQAAAYLVERGHRRLAYLSPKPDHLLMRNRETGFLAEALRLGIDVQRFVDAPAAGWQMPLTPPLGADSVQHLVDRLLDAPQRPTAVLVGSDSVAAAVYVALARRGLAVGRDLSVISGNNDTALIAGLHPSLTTFDIQAHEIGLAAVRRMAAVLAAGEKEADTELTIQPKFVERNSVLAL